MPGRYDKCKIKWNKIFGEHKPNLPSNGSSGNEGLDKGIQWVCEGTDTILDFGCGNGTLLFLCAFHGTKTHIGIDISEKAIENAQELSFQIEQGKFQFIRDGVHQLQKLDDVFFDAVILSNIIDNLYPEDAQIVLNETARILKDNGKVLVKLNPFITESQIKEWQIKIIKDNLLDDGFILWNNTTDQWKSLLEKNFNIHKFQEVYYPEHEQYNRMFLITKNILDDSSKPHRLCDKNINFYF